MKTLKVSPGIYETLKGFADTSDRSLHEVTDDLLTAGLERLGGLAPLVDQVEKDRTIEVREVNGVVYYCDECQYPLDPKEELTECPNCGAKLDWGEQKGGLGVVGWGLVGLALLLSLGARMGTQSNRM